MRIRLSFRCDAAAIAIASRKFQKRSHRLTTAFKMLSSFALCVALFFCTGLLLGKEPPGSQMIEGLGMPLPVLVWLANAVFVFLTVAIVFLTLHWIVKPPRSFAEGVIEAHKVIIVGGVSLAAVAIVEVISIAPKLTADNLAVVLIGVIVLCGDAFFGVGLFAAALVGNEKIVQDKRIDRPAFLQIILGLLVFCVATCIIIKFKYIDFDISRLEAMRAT